MRRKYAPAHYEERGGKKVGMYWYTCSNRLDEKDSVQVAAADWREARKKALPLLVTAPRLGVIDVYRQDGGTK